MRADFSSGSQPASIVFGREKYNNLPLISFLKGKIISSFSLVFVGHFEGEQSFIGKLCLFMGAI